MAAANRRDASRFGWLAVTSKSALGKLPEARPADFSEGAGSLTDRAIAGALLRIDLDALIQNYHFLCARVAPAVVAAVVKADAYGLGAGPVAAALTEAGCTIFFVAHLAEAIALRPVLSSDADLYVLNGLPPGTEAICAAAGVIPVLNSLDQVGRWSALASEAKRRLRAALQVDTGMSRLGLSLTDVDMIAADPQRLSGIDLSLVMSHLACADEPQHPANAAQLDAFEQIIKHFPGVARSIDNSGGALLARGHFDLVRAGIALYGGAPQSGYPSPMAAVVKLDARIIQWREVPAGVGVGYGLGSVSDRSRRIATIGVGYADGWPRRLGDRGVAFVAGRRVAIVGRVSMDSMTLDVTGLPDELLVPGSLVELLGPHQSIDDVAADADSIPYEILTQLGHRFARDHVHVGAMTPQRSVRE